MPFCVAPPDPLWDFMRAPCIAAGCSLDVTISQPVDLFGYFVQHGPNPEHRTFIFELDLRKSENWGFCLVRRWLERVHAPSVFEHEDAHPVDGDQGD